MLKKFNNLILIIIILIGCSTKNPIEKNTVKKPCYCDSVDCIKSWGKRRNIDVKPDTIDYVFNVKVDTIKSKNSNFVLYHFEEKAIFSEKVFLDTAYFRCSKFDKGCNIIYSKFKKRAHFQQVHFNGHANCGGSEFFGQAYFRSVLFSDTSNAIFRYCKFYNDIHFRGVIFGDTVNFEHTEFHYSPKLEGVRWGRILNFQYANFLTPVDFRVSFFDSVKKINLEGINFPNGQLFIDWDQIKAYEGNYKISLSSESDYDSYRNVRNEEDSLNIKYKRLERIYIKLKNNYVAQDNYRDADNVMYELKKREHEIKGDWCSSIQGCLSGWGYSFIRILVTIIIVYSISLLILITWLICSRKKGNDRKLKLILNLLNEKDINNLWWLTKVWHYLYFNFSLIFSLRFKMDWFIKYKELKGPIFVIWLIGKLLIVFLIFNVNSTRFEFIRTMLGFM